MRLSAHGRFGTSVKLPTVSVYRATCQSGSYSRFVEDWRHGFGDACLCSAALWHHNSITLLKSELDAKLTPCVDFAARNIGRLAMLFTRGFSFPNSLGDALTIFLFVVWLWLLITVAADLFRRHDISGWGTRFGSLP